MPLIPYEDLEFLNAYENHFQKSSEILENTIDFHKLYHKNNEQFQKSVYQNYTKPTKKCNWEDIKKYIKKENGFSEDIVDLIKKYNFSNQFYESLGVFYTSKKRKRNIETVNTTLETETIVSKGRITTIDKNNGKSGKHDKYESDNIIKKCKGTFISYVVENINIYLDKEKKYEKLLDLDYSLISKIKKDSDLELLNMKLKDLVSKDISSKYKSKLNEKDYNKNIINKIIQNEDSSEKLMNLLNMTFNEWIDIFTYKIENDYNKEYNLLQAALDKINQKNNNDKEYLLKFIFYLYNYKRWFESKKGRNTNEINDDTKLNDKV